MKDIRIGNVEAHQIDKRNLVEMTTFATDYEEIWNRLKLLKHQGRCEEHLGFVQKIKGLSKRRLSSKKIYSYIRQAEEYYEAGKNSSLATAPLLYYYGMLNLSKIPLVIWKNNIFNKEQNLFHGLTDPQRIKKYNKNPFRNQVLLTKDGIFSQLFTYFTGNPLPSNTKLNVINLLSHIIDTSIEFEETFNRDDNLIYSCFHRIFDTKTNTTWLVVYIEKEQLREKHMNVRGLLACVKELSKYFEQAKSPHEDVLFFQLKQKYVYKCQKKTGEDAINYIIDFIKKMNGYSTINSENLYLPLYKDYFPLPQANNLLASMFYFGNLVRYNPYYWDNIINDAKHPFGWYLDFFNYYVPFHFLEIIVGEIFRAKFIFNKTLGFSKRKGFYVASEEMDEKE